MAFGIFGIIIHQLGQGNRMSPFPIADLRFVVYLSSVYLPMWRFTAGSGRLPSAEQELPTALLRAESLPIRAVLLTTSTGSLLQPKSQYYNHCSPLTAEIPQGTPEHQREMYLHPRGHLRPSRASFPDKILILWSLSYSSLRLHMAANFRNWSKEGVVEQKGGRKEEEKQQVAGVEAGWDQKMSQVGASALYEPKTGLWWPHFAVWPKQRIHSVSIKSADRTNTCPLPRTARTVGHVSRGRAR
jgi:hypothetical protein